MNQYSIAPFTIYDVNNMPHIYYINQPYILYPIYVKEPSQSSQMPNDYKGFDQRNARFLPELVSGTGGVVEQQFNTMGVFAHNLEQNAINTVNETVKTSCLGLCKS